MRATLVDFASPMAAGAWKDDHLPSTLVDDRDTFDWSHGPGGDDQRRPLDLRRCFPAWNTGFEYVDVLGHGGFGVVFLALQRSLQRLVALKVLRPDLSRDPLLVQYLHEEAYTMAAVRSPRVVTVHDYVDSGEPPFIFMEFVEGASLSEHLGPRSGGVRRARPVEESLMIARWIAQALADLQPGGRRSIAHRDLTPRNIMLCVDSVKLLDLGLARAAYRWRREQPRHQPPGQPPNQLPGQPPNQPPNQPLDQQAAFGAAPGFTPEYAAPEQIRGQEAGPQADWFSLGVILFEMLTGRLPFGEGLGMEYAPRVIEGRVRWELLSSVPSPCRELLERCLAGNESQRGITPGEALRMLAFGTSAAVQQKSLQPRSNLPQPDEMVPLHGRDSDLEWVARALRHGKRGLVVLHGMPGVGKTRLAQEVAQHVARSDPTPWSSVAVWVSLRGLDPASGASGIREAISSALREVGGTGPESSTLSGALGPLLEEASTLLVLDNADHLGMAVASVAAELLHRHPRLRVLITTTDPSPFPASALRRVDPLRPPSMAISSVEEVAANPATALFCAFLAEHVPGFRVTAKTAPSIAAICARLGGIPMAMRLVASVGARFDPPEMLRNLDSIIGARLSQAGAYASVDQILDAGLSPLPANEAQLLGRLAVFSGGWSQELAESICADSGSPKESPSVAGQPLWAVMEWLERRGIVLAVGRGRRDLLDPFRRRAAAMLDRSGERPEVEERLRSTMLELVRQSIVGHEPPGWNQTQWLSRLAAEGDNLRVMWRLCCELKDRATRGEALTTIVRGLELLWQERGVPAHAKDWVAEALAYEAELHGSRERMSLFNAAGNVAMHAGCHAEADALWVRAASVAESASAARHKVIFEANRTLSAARQDDGARAIEHADAALRLAEACGLITDPTADPGSLSTQVLQARLARAHGLKCLERLGEARQEYEGLERPLRALGDHRRLYHVYLGLTQVDILERRPSSGRRRLREARRAFRAQRGPNADRWFVVVLHAKLWALDGGHPSIARRAKRAWLRFIDLGGRPGPFLGGFQEP